MSNEAKVGTLIVHTRTSKIASDTRRDRIRKPLGGETADYAGIVRGIAPYATSGDSKGTLALRALIKELLVCKEPIVNVNAPALKLTLDPEPSPSREGLGARKGLSEAPVVDKPNFLRPTNSRLSKSSVVAVLDELLSKFCNRVVTPVDERRNALASTGGRLRFNKL